MLKENKEKVIPVEYLLQYQAPEISLVKTGDKNVKQNFKEIYPINVGGVDYPTELHVSTNYLGDRLRELILSVNFTDPETSEIIGVFSGTLYLDSNPPYFYSLNRQVQPENRGKGLGSAGMFLIEEFLKKIKLANPSVSAESIQLRTALPNVARLITSHEWLKANNLDNLISSSGVDLGYEPRSEEDAENLKELLRYNTEPRTGIDFTDYVGQKVFMYKKLNY